MEGSQYPAVTMLRAFILFFTLYIQLFCEVVPPREGLTMGGSGVGGVTWFIASTKVDDSDGCRSESEEESVVKFVTVVGERPGAKRSLKTAGINTPQRNINLCILRQGGWVFRRGDVQLLWLPDQTGSRVTGREEKGVGEQSYVKTEL